MTDVYITLPKPQTNEGSSFTTTAYFRDSGDTIAAWADSKTYPAGSTVSDSGTLYASILGGTSSGTGVGDDSGVTDWVAVTAKYRVDCLTTGKKLTDWTSLTPAVSNSITMTATHNAMQDENNTRERKQITVAANPDTSTAVINTAYWDVINNQAY